MKRLFLTAFLTTAALPLLPSAWAGDSSAASNKAEHVRLTEEMKKLAQRNAWVAVEANYQKLLELEKNGEKLSYDDHWLGAQSARDMGDATAWRKRLLSAQALKQTEEVAASLAEVDANFSAVKITVDPRYIGERALSRPAMPFAPDQVANVRFVAAKLKNGESYEGLLVNGSYTFDGQPLEVATGKTASLTLDKTIVPFKSSAGLRATVGPAMLAVLGAEGSGDVVAVSETALTFGGRLGIGGEVSVARGFTLFGEVDYEGAVGSSSVPDKGNSDHTVGAWLGVSLQTPVLWISAGPVVSYGSYVVNSTSNATSSTVDPCYGAVLDSASACSTNATRQWPNAGSGILPGGALSLVIPIRPFKIGNLVGGVTVEGGALVPGNNLSAFGEVGLRFGQDYGG